MDTAEKVSISRKISLILLSVIFLLMSFSMMVNYYFIFILGVLALGISIYLAYSNLKKFDIYALLIYIIPILAIGFFYSISDFSRVYLDTATKVLIPFSLLVFGLLGMMLIKIPKFEIKWVFRGIFIGLTLVSIINLILTLYNYGPFYGFKYAGYYSYYGGKIAKESVTDTAYALCGFSIKQVPIQYYAFYPLLSLGSAIYFMITNKHVLFDKTMAIAVSSVGLISLIFVIGKFSVIIFAIILFFVILCCVLFIPKINTHGKWFKRTFYIIGGVVALFFFITILNAQYSFTGIRNLFSSNKFFNYVFNTNRYIEANNLVFNGLLSPAKLIGFPILFDESYEATVYPSYNIFTNQFMYSGLFGFFFMIVYSAALVRNFFKIREKNIENRINKFMPMFFIALFFVVSILNDVSYIDEYEFTKFVITPTNPFFLMAVMFGGYNQFLIYGGSKNE